MNVKQRTDRLFTKPKDGKVVEGLVGVMKYFGWTLEELRRVPLPSYFVLLETVNKMEKEAEEKSKRGRR